MNDEVDLNQDLFVTTKFNLVNLKAAISGILDVRRVDFSTKNLDRVVEGLRAHGITPVLKTVIAMNSGVCEELDMAVTMSGSTSPGIDVEIVVDKVKAEIGLMAKTNVVKNYAAVISGLNQWICDLEAPY
ncbi:hypothetical protein BOTCAL_0280g00140 [Botryotinia calthae]|uniref:Uncharacterized protein n=1 Tax=Botryotinia calthae TaxID=38488 RepID=A0A4Y8CXX5_9HELO|nr:hypothetical protein BOTCAL_0280g00140 [Botryotinia calthae]